MRTTAAWGLALALFLAGARARAEDAPAADTGKSTIEQIEPGEYWWGAEITKEDLRGKVVLWVTWGS
jgi:hypothetical protein